MPQEPAGGPAMPSTAGADPGRPGPQSRRRHPWRWLGRVLLLWLVNTAALRVLALLLPGLAVYGVGTPFVASALIGLLNAIFWPLLMRVLLPAVVYSLGLAALLMNGAAIWLAGQVLPGVVVANYWTAIVASVALTGVSGWISSLLAIDDDESYYRNVVLRLAGRASPPRSDVPGVFFLEIDGLAHAILLRAVRNGRMPTLGRWLRAGSHRVVRWECDLSSQTGASQAGILLGDNFDIPAFRWYEKETGRTVVTSRPESAAAVERRLSTGAGLLAMGGASRGNAFSGDAPQVLLTLSTIRDRGRFHADGFAPFFARSYNFTRLLYLFFEEAVREWREARRQRTRDIYPRISRGGAYPFLRAFTTVVLSEITVYALIGDLFAGTPVVYATFAGYDEVAHHSGPEREDALDVLERIDRQFARLEDAAALASRPYHFVVLSDHGQSQGATFRQRHGESLRQLVDRLTESDVSVEATVAEDKAWGYLDAALTESVTHGGRAPTSMMRRMVGRHLDGAPGADSALDTDAAGQAPIGAGPAADSPAADSPSPAEVVVLASGNLGLIYLTGAPRRLSLEEIEAAHPGLLARLAAHPWIGFVMAGSASAGPVVVGTDGKHFLRQGRVEGKDPLQAFQDNAGRHLLRADSYPHCPDILVNSAYDPQRDEVAAFEELVGSHGGLGGEQTGPFVLFPAEWPLADEAIVGPVALHHTLKDWLSRLGLARGAQPPAADTLPRPAAPARSTV